MVCAINSRYETCRHAGWHEIRRTSASLCVTRRFHPRRKNVTSFPFYAPGRITTCDAGFGSVLSPSSCPSTAPDQPLADNAGATNHPSPSVGRSYCRLDEAGCWRPGFWVPSLLLIAPFMRWAHRYWSVPPTVLRETRRLARRAAVRPPARRAAVPPAVRSGRLLPAG